MRALPAESLQERCQAWRFWKGGGKPFEEKVPPRLPGVEELLGPLKVSQALVNPFGQ